MSNEFEFIEVSHDEKDFNTVVRNKLGEKIKQLKDFGYDLLTDVAIITTNNFGELGVNKLNEYLRTIVNGENKKKIYIYGKEYFWNDKILFKRNNYEVDLYNGDVGVIRMLNWKDKTVTADFYGRKIVMDYKLLRDTIPAYVSTVHAVQGNEFKVAIFILPRFAEPLLNTRNLMYTAITRAKQKCVLISTKQTVWLCIDNKKEMERKTMLGRFIDETYA
jgi:exodeoxyribonuclease V alpha subunit